MKPFNLPFLLSIGLISILGSCTQHTGSENPWPDIKSETKPWTRWWWLGSEVDAEHIASLMEDFHDINFVNTAYEPFDASDWQTEISGLEGPVRLIPVRND